MTEPESPRPDVEVIDRREVLRQSAASRRRWCLLAAMCVAQLMVVLDATIVNVALPEAQRSLGFAAADRHWVVTSYALAFGSLLLIGGRVADLVGQRRAILAGLVGFGLASALGGAAGDLTTLVTARVLQGVSGALLAPAALAVITTTFVDEQERGRAFGVFGSVAAGGGAAGLLLGGVLTDQASWRWTLYVNTALAAVGILAALVTLTAAPRQARPGDRRVDIVGTATITIGLVGLVYGFSHAYEHGWTAPATLLCLALGVVLITVFPAAEAHVGQPILPLRVLASRVRGASLLVLLVGSVGLFAESLLLTYYLQDSLGFSPTGAGLAFLPQALGAVVGSLAGGMLMPRLSGRVLLPAGMCVTATGLLVLGRIGVDSDYALVVLPGIVLVGTGLGLAISVAVNLGVHGVRREDAGVASATVNAVQQVGGSIGPSLFNTVAGSLLAGYLAGGAADAVGADRAAAVVRSYATSFDLAALLVLATAMLVVALLGLPRRRGLPGEDLA